MHDVSNEVEVTTDYNYINILKTEKNKHKNRCLLSYLNINSYRNKHFHLNDVFSEKLIDVLIIAETKLTDSYCSSEFVKPGYRMFRRDRSDSKHPSGGLICYVNNEIPVLRKSEYECKHFDSIALELHVSRRKWLCISIYRSKSLLSFLLELELLLDAAMCKYDDIIIIGDFNVNMLKENSESKQV